MIDPPKAGQHRRKKGFNDEVKEKLDIEPEKIGSLEITCLNCGGTFTPERKTRKFYSGKCKTAYYRNTDKKEVLG